MSALRTDRTLPAPWSSSVTSRAAPPGLDPEERQHLLLRWSRLRVGCWPQRPSAVDGAGILPFTSQRWQTQRLTVRVDDRDAHW
jgi:hypothetical protein